MKPKFLKVATKNAESFSVREDRQPHMNNIWHYHPEVELTYVRKGKGTQFIGDSTKNFRDGNLVLLGSYLPHYWHFEEQLHQEMDVKVVHFNPNFWGKEFLLLPENQAINQLLQKAKLGLEIHGPVKEKIIAYMKQLIACPPGNRIVSLLQLLTALTASGGLSPLCSVGFEPVLEKEANNRINTIYEYSIEHFKEKISIHEIADKVGLSPHSFCRYFKSRTGKTYSRFLLEIRVGHACNLLHSNNMSIKDIGFESGFFNITGFHKYFKEIKGLSPLAYKNALTSDGRF